MNYEHIREYVSGLIHNKPLPEKPKGKISKAELREYQRSLKEAKEVNERFKKDRRKVLIGLGAGISSAIFAAEAPNIVNSLFFSSSPMDKEQNFTGEIEQTKDLIHKWNNEIGLNPDKYFRYAPQISNLAAVYYSRQMTRMFPDLAERYNTDLLKNRFRFYSTNMYEKGSKCPEDNDFVSPASTDADTKIISISPEKLINSARFKNEITLTHFLVSIHELIHSTTKRRSPTGSIIVKDTELLRRIQIAFIGGLKLFEGDPNKPDDKCGASWWWEVEETVDEHATTDLVSKVGIKNKESRYMPWVNAYQSQVINPLFSGRYQELFKYQQESDIDNFMSTIGGRIIGENAPIEEKIARATHLVVPLLDVRRLG